MANNQYTTNCTNLNETYMYSKASSKVNFYQYSKNYTNSVDDPIFTGFTFDIDMATSPLFHNGNGDLYTFDFGTLRSQNGSDSTLARKIEAYLVAMYKSEVMSSTDTYSLLTVSAKNILNTMYKAGYGLQDSVHMDNILYGAVEYIYMVDKVPDGIFTDTSTDVGNGTANSTLTEEDDTDKDDTGDSDSDYSGTPVTNNQVNPSDIAADENGKYDIKNKIKELEDKLKSDGSEDNPIVAEHKNNVKEKIELEQKYYATCSKRYDAEKTVNEGKESYNDEKTNALNKYNDYVSQMKSLYTSLKNTPTDSSIQSKIENTYNSFTTFANNLDIDYPDITISYCKGTLCKDSLTEEQVQVKQYFDYTTLVTESQMSVSGFNKSSKDIMDSAYAKINSVNKELFGTDKNGNALTGSTADESSVYGKYAKAVNKLENDEYTHITQQIAELKEALADEEVDTIDGGTIQASVVVADRVTKSTDVTTPTTSSSTTNSYSSTLNEVPQTVYDMLGFIAGMKKLTYDYPYVMQSITGLDEAYKSYFQIKDPYLGSGDNKITISCYDSLDLRVSSMFNKYFNAVYDRQYRRERVPINLRRFNCSVFVHDIRNFRHALNNKIAEKKYGDNTKSRIVEIALNYVSAIEFKFYDCEIVPEETGGIFDSVTNEGGGDMKKTNFSFTYGNCVINFLPFEDLMKYYNGNEGTAIDKPSVHGAIGNAITANTTSKSIDPNGLGDVNTGEVRESAIVNGLSDVNTGEVRESAIVNGLGWATDLDKILYAEEDYLGNIMDYRIFRGLSASTGLSREMLKEEFGYSGPDRPGPDRPQYVKSDKINDIGNVGGRTTMLDNVSEIGDVVPDGKNLGTVTEIGDVIPDVEPDDVVEEIGDLIPDDKIKDITTEIGDVIPDVEPDDVVEEIGDLIPDDKIKDITTEIGDVIPDVEPGDVTMELGDLIPDVEPGDVTMELGDVIPDVEPGNITDELGDLIPDVEPGDVTNELGDLVVDNSKSSMSTEIGQVEGEGTVVDITKNLGDLITDNFTGKLQSEIGQIDNTVTTSKTTTEIGDLVIDNSTSTVQTEIGQMNGYGQYKSRMVDDLGDVDMNESTEENTGDLGKLDGYVKEKSQPTDDLGKVE